MDTPSELTGALARIAKATQDYHSLEREIDKFLYKYVEGMILGLDPKTGGFGLKLRHPKESSVSGEPQVLVGQIVENLRSALDYMVFELSVKNHPNLEKRQEPQFVICNSESDFKKESRRGRKLHYLTKEQKIFMEKWQPYHENDLLRILRDVANQAKHRRLLEIRNATDLDIRLAEAANKDQYKGFWMYPREEGMAYFVKSGSQRVVLMNKYDAMATLKWMIRHVGDIVRASFRYFV